MTNEQIIGVISHAKKNAEGRYINVEVRMANDSSDEWMLASFPNWDFSVYDYRIKPETKRIPLTKEDLIDRIKEGKTMWIRHSITEYFEQIESFSPHYVSLHSHIDSMEYQYLTDFTFIDGTPCYKEVECE